jgi:uncharacterized Tic20 family protein
VSAKEQYTQEERLLAAISHAAVITGAIGPVVGVLVYITQKEKSAYAARQGLQAAIYQLIGLLVIILAWSCWGLFYALTFIPLIADPEQYSEAPPAIFWVGMASMICPFIIMGLWLVYGLYGAVRAWSGAEFRYAIIGQLVDDRLSTTGDSA